LADVLVVIGISKGKAFFITPASIIPQVITTLHESLILTDCKSRIQYINPTLSRWTGYPENYYVGKNVNELFAGPIFDPTKLEQLCEVKIENVEKRLKTNTQSPLYVSVSASNVQDKQGKRYGVVFTLTDVTVRKNIEKARQESEKRFRELFEDSPMSVWEEDFSLLKKKLSELRADKIIDLRLYMVEHPQFIQECASLIRVLDVNRASIKLFEAKNKRQLLGVSSRLIPDVAKSMFVEELITMWEGKTEFEMEGINHTLAGRRMYVNVRWTIPPDHIKTWSRVLVLVTDITPRKTAEMERTKLFEELQQMAIVDSLTGVYNRRYFLAMAQNEVELARKYGNAVSTIMIDLDLFKKINDHYGHNFGDKVLGAVALEIKKSLRKVDILCRYGGDEFMILLPDVEAVNAMKTADRIRERILAKTFEIDEKTIGLSASMGVAQLSTDANDLDAVLTRADIALYAAKSRGRNRAVLWSKDLKIRKFGEGQKGVALTKVKKIKEIS
jgi:diguanylate cyclase (GGDEF)-like protein/PAS domain S-box-containing protein